MLSRRYKKQCNEVKNFRPVYHINAFAHILQPVITDNPEIQKMSWGLIPFWVKDNDEAEVLKNHTINARGETVFEKPAFRTAIRDTRCLIPVTGFFDWRHDGKIKTPYFISLKKDEVYSM